MKSLYKLASVLCLAALLLTFATPVYAYDGRAGEDLVIAEGETIDDDLYVGARSLTLDGTVTGDLVVGAQTVIINGTVEGDLIAGAQTVIIKGTVGDDARLFAAAIQLDQDASVGGDLIAMGASVETKDGSSVGADVVSGAAQVLLAGETAGDVLAGTGGLELRGPVGGNVTAYVNATEDTASAPPLNLYMSQSPIALPAVKPGLTFGQGAHIGGNLAYTSTVDLAVPSGVVAGTVRRLEVTSDMSRPVAPRVPTPAERVGDWVFAMLRSMITLILFGLLFTWLFPRFMRVLPEDLRDQPLLSLGWGAVTFAAVFIAAFVIVIVTIMLVVAGLRWNMFWLGWLLLSALGVAFFFATAYIAKVVVGDAVGSWILSRLNSPLANHAIWPMVIGLVVLVLLIGVLNFPLLPFGFFGWLLNFVVVLFGLGALWIWGRRAWAARKAVAA